MIWDNIILPWISLDFSLRYFGKTLIFIFAISEKSVSLLLRGIDAWVFSFLPTILPSIERTPQSKVRN